MCIAHEMGKKWLTGIACAGVLAIAPIASAAMIGFDFEDDVNPFSNGTIVTDQAFSGDKSLFVAPGQNAFYALPAEFVGKDIAVTMQVYDHGMWINRSGGHPTSVNGARWGVSRGTGDGEHVGVSITERTFLGSNLGYAINTVQGRTASWFSFTFYSTRSVVSPDGGSSVLIDTGPPEVYEYTPGTPADPGVWSLWTFDITSAGVVTLWREGRPTFVHDVGGPITELYLRGGNTGVTGGLLSNLWVDDITIVPEPTSLALIGVGGLMLLRRRRA